MAISAPAKKKQKKSYKNANDFFNSHKGVKSELWVDVNSCFISPLKIDRKTKDEKYIAQLAEDLKARQINAVVVREAGDKYEIITGECRYEAAKLACKKLLVRVVNWSDEEAISTIISENDKREDLCDYDKALAYLEYKGGLSIRAFAEKHNLDRNYVNRLFKVNKIPESVRSALPMTDMSASQFEEIAAKIKENSSYVDAFLDLAPLLSQIETAITWKAFLMKVDRKVNPPERKNLERYVFKSKDKEIGNIKQIENGYSIVVKKKMTQGTYKMFERELGELLEKYAG